MSYGTHVSLIHGAELICEEQDFIWESGTSAKRPTFGPSLNLGVIEEQYEQSQYQGHPCRADTKNIT